VTTGAGDSTEPLVSDEGRLVAFSSTSDDVGALPCSSPRSTRSFGEHQSPEPGLRPGKLQIVICVGRITITGQLALITVRECTATRPARTRRGRRQP
jgi:hypothetical protein